MDTDNGRHSHQSPLPTDTISPKPLYDPMAEVLQPLHQPSSTITMIQSRPSSSDAFQGSNNSSSYLQSQRTNHNPRASYTAQSSYRATSAAPVQPYAFQSTPHLRQETRTISAPNSASLNSSTGQKQAQQGSLSTSASPVGKRVVSKDDLTDSRPTSFINLSSSVPDLSLVNFDTTPKASPDRYRRGSRRTDSSGPPTPTGAPQYAASAAPTGSGMSAVEHLYTPPAAPAAPMIRTVSDDNQPSKAAEAAKRYRRRSLGNFENATPATAAAPSGQTSRPSSSGPTQNTSRPSSPGTGIRPPSSHGRTGSRESAKFDAQNAAPERDSPRRQQSPSRSSARADASTAKVSSRGSSEGQKRTTSPSPLSQAASTNDPHANVDGQQKRAIPTASPAAQHLAALSDKDLNKGMKSRLRRAFSFGSAAELRKASENIQPGHAGPHSHMRQQMDGMTDEEREQEEIARRQEAAGIGAGIYSGQGGFTGSSDNLSISSTASSASIMLRKMGQGVKKGGRSLKGLFRPKSVVGVPAADGPIQPSLAQVSMVTVEAERQKVNINAHPADQPHGGTGFPKLERNSIDANHATAVADAAHERPESTRRSIVGNDKDRAEVLAAVKKGILKRVGTNSPVSSPAFTPREVNAYPEPMTLSPASSVPGTPKDERQSRSLTSTNSSNNDYFGAGPRPNAARSMPATPVSSRNISFSPRIQFHDVWSATEYDRRGEIATCNRLTPVLAQQIKEELNTFKMEMEVHELSKPHTHFF